MADDLTRMMTDQPRDAYSAEKQALRGMARVMKKASTPSLKAAIQTHIDQTEGQIERLDRASQPVPSYPNSHQRAYHLDRNPQLFPRY